MSTFDKNLVFVNELDVDDVVWHDASREPFRVYGFDGSEEGFLSRRMPLKDAERVSGGVAFSSGKAAGGRVRFSTDSPYIALRAEYGEGQHLIACGMIFCYGFDLYRTVDGRDTFVHAYRPDHEFDRKVLTVNYKLENDGEVRAYTLNMPCFAEVKRLCIGVKEGSRVLAGASYRNEKPIIFYGSSITHGAAASRPGNIYEGFISQKYNLDYVNLGFSGRAKGEAAMAEYIAGREMSMFVCDYDHNADSPEHLAATHYAFYEIIRKKHPDIPCIMISKPDFFTNPVKNARRRDIIKASYLRAKEAGDERVYFIDGETLFGGEAAESCTADGVHPNDLGFFRMSQVIGEVIRRAHADVGIDICK